MRQRYYKSKADALKNMLYYNEYLRSGGEVEVFRMPKGTRHHGMYYVGTYMEWLNFAN